MGLLDKERFPYVSELSYFALNPNVAGMMTEDNMVILRPDLFGDSRDSVRKNEAIRLLLSGYAPTSQLTRPQSDMFKGSAYESDNLNAMRSILARIGAKDPSANQSFSQDSEYRKLNQIGGILGGY